MQICTVSTRRQKLWITSIFSLAVFYRANLWGCKKPPLISTSIGFHLGVGKEIAFDDIHSLDVYGKYFYNRRNGVSFDAGGHYDLDAVTSQVVRVGARYTLNLHQKPSCQYTN